MTDGARVSFRLNPETKELATRIATDNGMTLAGMVREFLIRYTLTDAEPVRTLPNTRGARTCTLYIGAKLARAARRRAQENDEDLSRPIVEFLTRTVEAWQREQETPTTTAPQPQEIP